MIATARKLNPLVSSVGRLGKCICEFGKLIFSRTDAAVESLNFKSQCGDVGVEIVDLRRVGFTGCLVVGQFSSAKAKQLQPRLASKRQSKLQLGGDHK